MKNQQVSTYVELENIYCKQVESRGIQQVRGYVGLNLPWVSGKDEKEDGQCSIRIMWASHKKYPGYLPAFQKLVVEDSTKTCLETDN